MSTLCLCSQLVCRSSVGSRRPHDILDHVSRRSRAMALTYTTVPVMLAPSNASSRAVYPPYRSRIVHTRVGTSMEHDVWDDMSRWTLGWCVGATAAKDAKDEWISKINRLLGASIDCRVHPWLCDRCFAVMEASFRTTDDVDEHGRRLRIFTGVSIVRIVTDSDGMITIEDMCSMHMPIVQDGSTAFGSMVHCLTEGGRPIEFMIYPSGAGNTEFLSFLQCCLQPWAALLRFLKCRDGGSLTMMPRHWFGHATGSPDVAAHCIDKQRHQVGQQQQQQQQQQYCHVCTLIRSVYGLRSAPLRKPAHAPRRALSSSRQTSCRRLVVRVAECSATGARMWMPTRPKDCHDVKTAEEDDTSHCPAAGPCIHICYRYSQCQCRDE